MTEPVQIVEIKQPFCANTYGSAPCTASGGADAKCYNTRSTCQDAANFSRTTLSLFFSTGQVADRGVSGAPYIIPSLVSVSTAPTKINLAGSSPDAQGLGNRALCSIVFADHQHTDRIVDPYLSGRSWNPLDADRGTFWQRWISRNKYRQNIEIVVYEGYKGQALSAMSQRTYFLESIQGPTGNGRVTIKGKDILARVEDRKAQAPLASPGLIYTDISDSVTSVEVANAVEADYAASGVLRIGDEIVTYTARAASTNGITFTGVARGQFNTTADAHTADTAVQQCLYYDNQRADDIVEDLLTTYAGVDSSWLDTSNWADEFDDYSTFYVLSALVTEPTAVTQLLSELMVQVGVYLWWDERAALVKWKAIRGVDEQPDLITDEVNIIEGTFSISEMPRQRVSQVWIYYDQDDFIANPDEPDAYREQFVLADLEAETEELYGEQSIRKIYARWLDTSALAENTASKIIVRYVDTPTSCVFEMDAKDRAYWVGDTVRISHFMDRDEFGVKRVRNWTIVSAEETVPGERARYTAEDTTLYGQIFYVMAGAAADYNPAGGNPFKNCYIGDASGLLSDGTDCGRIA